MTLLGLVCGVVWGRSTTVMIIIARRIGFLI